jgi:hypothetical protein
MQFLNGPPQTFSISQRRARNVEHFSPAINRCG